MRREKNKNAIDKRIAENDYSGFTNHQLSNELDGLRAIYSNKFDDNERELISEIQKRLTRKD